MNRNVSAVSQRPENMLLASIHDNPSEEWQLLIQCISPKHSFCTNGNGNNEGLEEIVCSKLRHSEVYSTPRLI